MALVSKGLKPKFDYFSWERRFHVAVVQGGISSKVLRDRTLEEMPP